MVRAVYTVALTLTIATMEIAIRKFVVSYHN